MDADSGLPLISADLIKTVARTVGVTNVQSTGSVEVVNLRLPGMDPINGRIDPNTKIDIPIGFVRFNGSGAWPGRRTPARARRPSTDR